MSWADTVQATLMIFALILTPIIVLLATGGIDTHIHFICPQQIEEALKRTYA